MTLMDRAPEPPTALPPGTPASDFALPSPTDQSQRLSGLRGQTVAYSIHSFGAVFAEVRVHVDPDRGQIRVTRTTGAYGIGMALLEQTVPDPRYGRVMNADLPLTLDNLI